MKTLICLLSLFSLAGSALAHDTWIETHTPRALVGESMPVALKLGNHGNNHRDFKIAGQVDPRFITLDLIAPGGERTDLKPGLSRATNDAGEKYWTLDVNPRTPGLHMIACLDDKVVHYAPKRSIKSAKVFFTAARSSDDRPLPVTGFDAIMGHPLELVPTSGAIASPHAETPIEVQLLFDGQPLADARVSFIPRGVELQEAFDATYERMTDEHGRASFTPDDEGVHLIVAHHEDPTASGEGYESTKYSATLTFHHTP